MDENRMVMATQFMHAMIQGALSEDAEKSGWHETLARESVKAADALLEALGVDGTLKPRTDLAPGDLHIVSSDGSAIMHALASGKTTTHCGRDARAWVDFGTQNVGEFTDHAYACRGCLRAMAND